VQLASCRAQAPCRSRIVSRLFLSPSPPACHPSSQILLFLWQHTLSLPLPPCGPVERHQLRYGGLHSLFGSMVVKSTDFGVKKSECCFFFDAGDWTQGLIPARLVCYHLPSPFSFYFWESVSVNCAGWPWTCNLIDSASKVTGITGMSHHTNLSSAS
jgi:hypothetical protein